MTGTPCDVPVPKKVILKMPPLLSLASYKSLSFYRPITIHQSPSGAAIVLTIESLLQDWKTYSQQLLWYCVRYRRLSGTNLFRNAPDTPTPQTVPPTFLDYVV